MDGPMMLERDSAHSHPPSSVRLPARKRGSQPLRSQTAGEEISYTPVSAEPPAPTNYELRHQGRESYGRLVCSPAWGMGLGYPPRATNAATAMKACDGIKCQGRLYPFYYRTAHLGEQWLCYDCWQNVLLQRQRDLEAWYGEEQDIGDSSPSGAAIAALGNMLTTVGDKLCEVEIAELELLPEDEESLRREIARAKLDELSQSITAIILLAI